MTLEGFTEDAFKPFVFGNIVYFIYTYAMSSFHRFLGSAPTCFVPQKYRPASKIRTQLCEYFYYPAAYYDDEFVSFHFTWSFTNCIFPSPLLQPIWIWCITFGSVNTH